MYGLAEVIIRLWNQNRQVQNTIRVETLLIIIFYRSMQMRYWKIKDAPKLLVVAESKIVMLKIRSLFKLYHEKNTTNTFQPSEVGNDPQVYLEKSFQEKEVSIYLFNYLNIYLNRKQWKSRLIRALGEQGWLVFHGVCISKALQGTMLPYRLPLKQKKKLKTTSCSCVLIDSIFELRWLMIVINY